MESLIGQIHAEIYPAIRSGSAEECLKRILHFRLLYRFCKVRGQKLVVRYLSHEVVDLRYLLAILEQLDPSDTGYWEMRFVLLAWLSVVCLTPFSLASVDSRLQVREGPASFPGRVSFVS